MFPTGQILSDFSHIHKVRFFKITLMIITKLVHTTEQKEQSFDTTNSSEASDELSDETTSTNDPET